ncbi:putative permease, partial [Lachnellula suecica]
MASLSTKISALKRAFSSRASLIQFLETKESAHGNARSSWTNSDLDISPPQDWTWSWRSYAAFWWSYGFSTGVWTVGSSLIAVGLNSWQAIICVFISHLLGATGMAMHSRSAAVYHFGFPVASRIPWGMLGGLFPVFVRTLVGTVWNGIQLMQGGYFTSVLLSCIIGKPFLNMHNPIHTSADITTQQLIGLLLFFFGTLPLLAVPVTKVKVVFMVKSVVLPPVVIGLFVFCMLKGKGQPAGTFGSAETLRGSALAWAMLSGINSTMGKTASNIVNQPDLARYARTRTAPLYSQLLALPIGNTLCASLGIFATSAIKEAWGLEKAIWNPWDLCAAILTHYWSAAARAGIAVVSLGFLFSIMASNLGVNVIPWGADISTYFPRWLNIRRGMYLSYVFAIAVCPWKILTSATSFLRFLGGYSIFLGPFVGISLTDYLVVRKGNVWVGELYSGDPNGRYWYTGGVHWRSCVAYIVAVVLPIPGFATLFGNDLPGAWLKIYEIGWILTCVVSSMVYFALTLIGNVAKDEKGMRFEQVADDESFIAGLDDVEAVNTVVLTGE